MRETLVGAGARPIGHEAYESLRIEAGTPLFGHDVDESVLLPEIPFENLLSHTKGCYPGQEVVVRIRDRGHVNRTLRGLTIDGDQVPEQGAEVLADDTTIGRVTTRGPVVRPLASDRAGVRAPPARRAGHACVGSFLRHDGGGHRQRAAVRALTTPWLTNRLAGETSPYLLQHAHNPVDWYPWGDEAFARARAGGQADLPLDRLLGLPLVPRDGARVVRERRDRRAAERALRQRSRSTARSGRTSTTIYMDGRADR